ncbi:MAG TPA: MMPL family transporter [Burkholderiales bacterium]|nr:MMPL family transporter [Burkholderiales bacterium]
MPYRRTALLTWLAIVAASAWWTARHVVVTSDLTAFLPAASGRLERLLVEQLRAGVASRTMLVAIEGGAPPELARFSRELARAIALDRRFDYVMNGAAEFTRGARELGLKHRYLLSPTVSAGRFSEQSLARELRRNLERFATLEGTAFKAMIASDPTGELRSLAETAGQGAPASRHGVWFSKDGARALLVAQTAASGIDAVRQQEAADALADAFRQTGAGPEYRVLITGPGVFAARTRAAIEHDTRWLTGLAGAVVLLILVLVYRSPGPVALSALPVLTGLVVGVAAVGALFGSVHGITLAFGATVIGEAVDYPSYVFTQRKAGESLHDILARVWPTLRLAVLTTVFGSLALLLSSLQGLSQLGVLSMVGVLAAGLVTRWVLPALAPGRGAPPPRTLPFSLVRAGLALRSVAWIAWMLLAAALAFTVARHDRIWDDDLGHLSPLPESARQLHRQLSDDLRAPDVGYLLIATAASREAALEKGERLTPALQSWVAEGVLEGFDLAVRYLPSAKTQALRRAALPEAQDLHRSLARALRGLPYRADAFAPFERDVEAARTGPLLTIEDLRGTGLDLKVQTLLASSGGEWHALIPLRGMRDAARVRSLAAQLPEETRASFLDLKGESDRLIGGYRSQALELAGLGAVAIAVLLWFGLRGVVKAVRVMLPVYAAIAMTVACLMLLGIGLSLFHLVSLLLVLGIGLNYSLFFSRAQPGTDSEQGTSLALSVCFLTTFAAFGCLATSRIPVLSAIGLTVTLGCALSLLNSMMLGGTAAQEREAR